MLNSKKHLKKKAVFQILLITFLAFTLYIPSIETVEAQTQDVCCAETISGESCVYTDSSNCAPGSQSSAATCEQTSFCKLGCGFDQNDGLCFNNMPKFSCENKEGCSWSPDAECNIPQCERGCCVLSNQCSFTTQVQCKQVTSQYEDINMTFDENINSEIACLNQCRSFERGACVSPDGSCLFTTRDACTEENQEGVNVTLPLVGFYPDMLCSNARLGTECAPQHTTGCLPEEDEVYWFDSCGNAENIYSSDKPSSYNGGFILEKEKSCGYGGTNVNSETCGNCDYSLGSLCGEAAEGTSPVYGDYACRSLACDGEVVTVDPNAPATGTLPLDNGESWCAYDGLIGANANAGLGLDLAGSRHYRRICINGEEFSEPCKDFREEMCVQGEVDPNLDPALQLIYGTQESFERGGTGDSIIYGACRDNRFQDCVNIKTKEACENSAQRDCLWILGDKKKVGDRGDQKITACVPLVSPGLKHWSGESTTGATSKVDPKATCEKGNTECTVYFAKGGFENIVGADDWDCVGNCECLTEGYLKDSNAVCKSLGDCGAWYNIAGEKSCSGFVENLDAQIDPRKNARDLNVCSVLPPFGNLQGRGGPHGKDVAGFDAFFDEAVLSIWGGLGIVTTAVVLDSAIGASMGVIDSLIFGPDLLFSSISEGGFTAGLNSAAGISAEIAAQEAAKVALTQAQTNLAAAEATKASAINALGGATGPAQTARLTRAAVDATNALTAAEAELAKAELGAAGEAVAIANPTLTWIFGAVQVLMWAYLAYQLIDIVFAKEVVITIGCNVWQAPTGGDNCELCQEDGKECSEYRCRSLGQSCKLVNEGSEDETCISSNVNDVNPPYIDVNKELTVHLTDGLNNVNEITEAKGKGFEIVPKIPPFTAVTLVIDTNEYAQCKYDVELGKNFDEMVQFFGDGVYDKTHEMLFSLPGALAEPEALKLTNGGEYQLYIKCQDGNGNQNEADYYAKFAIDDGPDFTPPIIEVTSIVNGAYVPAGVNETEFSIYVNEPSNCRWDDISVAFDDMYNEFSCDTNPFPTSSLYYGLYECETTLTGIEDQRDNYYYFKCEDKPSKPKEERNVNMESFDFLLRGTTGLEITDVDPDDWEELKFNSPTLKVITSGGAFGNGDSFCGYNFDVPGWENGIEFLNTNSSVHEQPFFNLTAGEYNVHISCIDIAGNLANETSEFSVVVDVHPPQIQQIYTSPGILHIVTDEPSTCEYSVENTFAYGNGIPMTGILTHEHTASREGDTYYLACTDSFGNVGNYVVYL